MNFNFLLFPSIPLQMFPICPSPQYVHRIHTYTPRPSKYIFIQGFSSWSQYREICILEMLSSREAWIWHARALHFIWTLPFNTPLCCPLHLMITHVQVWVCVWPYDCVTKWRICANVLSWAMTWKLGWTLLYASLIIYVLLNVTFLVSRTS